MQSPKLIFSIPCLAAWLASACLIVPLTAVEPKPDTQHKQNAPSRIHDSLEEAQELLRKGDDAYQAGRYADAIEAYAGAREMIPGTPPSAELRAAATERYVQASVEQARLLSRKGDLAAAIATVDKVLRANIAPKHPAALACREQLDDPIRTNPALTAEHAQHVDAVRRLLYTAEGAYGLGQFTQAKKHYEAVLRIDPTNTAAQRGLEQIASAKSDYQKSAHDHTRAEMLGQVDAAWELQIPVPEAGAGLDGPNAPPSNTAALTIAAKLDRIIIPKIAMEQASLEEAIDFLRLRVTENDTMETDPSRKGVNFTVNLGPPESPVATSIRNQRFDLKLSQIPLSQVLKHLTDITHTAFTTDDFSVLITPTGSSSNELISRSYRVPPDFITNLSSGAAASGAGGDPFAAASAKEGLLTTRLSAQDALAKQGVLFPEGASANYSAATNTLRVINTELNQEAISQIVSTMTQTEPVIVVVRVTMIKTQQTNLQELGFDWLVSPIALNSANQLFGSGGTLGNGATRTAADFISPVNGTTIDGVPANASSTVNPGIMTNGNRSGNYAMGINNLDSLLNNPDREAQTRTVAPGVLAVTGLFSNHQIQMVMRGLNQKKGVDVMAQPAIVTRSGQSSKIEIVREFIYPTEYEPPQVPQSTNSASSGGAGVTPAMPTAFTTKTLGITFEVSPVVSANKKFIDITLNPSFSDFAGFVNYGSPINTTNTNILGVETVTELSANRILMPIFNVQKLATQLTVADGATIALGGLKQESVENVDDRVPFFGNIPVLGRLFQSTAKQPISTAIIVLVNVELLDPTGRPYRDP